MDPTKPERDPADPQTSPPAAADVAPIHPILRVLVAYNAAPLYLRIVGGLMLGVLVGAILYATGAATPPAEPAAVATTQPTTTASTTGPTAPAPAATTQPATTQPATTQLATTPPAATLPAAAEPAKPSPPVAAVVAGGMDLFAKYVIQFLAALAPPLILLAIVRALMTARIEGRQGGYMIFLLVLNTTVAICVGLAVANVVQPGRFAHGQKGVLDAKAKADVWQLLLDNIPKSLLEPLVSGRVIGVVIVALVFGFAARRLVGRHRQLIQDLVESGFDMTIMVLHWVIWLVPLAVFCKVGSILGTEGYAPFVGLGVFILAVLLALALQATWYLLRIKWRSWVHPVQLIRQTRDALVMAFSTSSSTATMPVTYELLRRNVGLRERSASLGALVGSNFNNDGTALYEAMAALFVAQMLHMDLSFGQQVLIVLTSVVASVGAAGIPEAGLVTMTLVFTAVGLPPEYIPFLIPVDWFLDRCRTAINVMGDMNVSCLLDGKEREKGGESGGAGEPLAAAS